MSLKTLRSGSHFDSCDSSKSTICLHFLSQNPFDETLKPSNLFPRFVLSFDSKATMSEEATKTYQDPPAAAEDEEKTMEVEDGTQPEASVATNVSDPSGEESKEATDNEKEGDDKEDADKQDDDGKEDTAGKEDAAAIVHRPTRMTSPSAGQLTEDVIVVPSGNDPEETREFFEKQAFDIDGEIGTIDFRMEEAFAPVMDDVKEAVEKASEVVKKKFKHYKPLYSFRFQKRLAHKALNNEYRRVNQTKEFNRDTGNNITMWSNLAKDQLVEDYYTNRVAQAEEDAWMDVLEQIPEQLLKEYAKMKGFYQDPATAPGPPMGPDGLPTTSDGVAAAASMPTNTSTPHTPPARRNHSRRREIENDSKLPARNTRRRSGEANAPSAKRRRTEHSSPPSRNGNPKDDNDSNGDGDSSGDYSENSTP